MAEGYLLYNIHDRYTGQAIARYGEYCAEEMQTLGSLCGPGDVVIDVGANIGTHAVALAKRVGPQGRGVPIGQRRRSGARPQRQRRLRRRVARRGAGGRTGRSCA